MPGKLNKRSERAAAALAAAKHAGVHSGKVHFHAVGSTLEAYPVWLTTLRGAKGCYIIRDKRTQKVLYVGSSRNRLYSTVTRHFQQWKRRKKWWSGSYGAGHDPGMTYPRERCEVGIIVLPAHVDQLAVEARMIARYKPHDNLIANPDGRGSADEVPF